ncbi:MAG: flavin reductase [Cyclobacteriaceae bacterium]|nr:flavin reductase [Cyclobacteriaceae bacterium]
MLQKYSSADISNWDRYYRANFISCLSGYKPAMIVGSIKENGLPNAGIFQNIVHIGAQPPLIGFINRPRAASPHTIANIERSGLYTMNSVHRKFIENAHKSSAKFDLEVDEFEAIGLKPKFREAFSVPFVSESQIQMLLRLEEVIPIQKNGTFLVIGEVQAVWLDDVQIEEDGFIQLSDNQIVGSVGLDGYYSAQLEKRYPYARP